MVVNPLLIQMLASVLLFLRLHIVLVAFWKTCNSTMLSLGCFLSFSIIYFTRVTLLGSPTLFYSIVYSFFLPLT
jgi:hypothetical protein